jgi:hypothetical protein
MKKRDLLDILEKNRKEHRAIFVEAQAGFKNAVVKQLEERLKAARENRHVELFIRLNEPVDQTSDYDRVIKMLELSTEETVELNEQDFSQYVEDNWNWRHQFLVTNSAYSETASASAKRAGIVR